MNTSIIQEFSSLIDLLEDLDARQITGREKRRNMEQFMLRKARLKGRPYCASFELTPLCNFDCKMCYMHLTREQMEREGSLLTTEQWLDIMRQAVDAGVVNVDITGGECLTHPGFREIYTYLAKRGVHVSVLTNGQLVDDELIRLFRKYPPSVVQISLYGSSPEAYLRVTGRDAFADVMGAIERLKQASVPVSLSITPHRFMQEDVTGLLELVHSLNVDYRIGSTTLPARPATGRDIADFIVDNEVYKQIHSMESQYRREVAKQYSSPVQEPYQFRIKDQEKILGTPCSAGSGNFHINWKGEMTPCIAFYTVAKSVLSSSLEEAWIWIRDTMRGYRPPEECKTCPHKAACMGCSAEKTAGILNGELNRWVCRRCAAMAAPDSQLSEYNDSILNRECTK